jgi:hypothetical protein
MGAPTNCSVLRYCAVILQLVIVYHTLLCHALENHSNNALHSENLRFHNMLQNRSKRFIERFTNRIPRQMLLR